MSRRTKQSKLLKSIIGFIVVACIAGGGYLGADIFQNEENIAKTQETSNFSTRGYTTNLFF